MHHHQPIRRTADLPHFAVFEQDNGKNYPYQLDLGSKLTATYRWSRSQSLTGEDGDVTRRTLFAWLHEKGRSVGAMQFQEYVVSPSADDDTFIEEMDTHSFMASHVASVLLEHWSIEDVVDVGSIVLLENVWVHPDHARGTWWAMAANALLSRFRYASLLLLKAFPLEYEGKAPRGTPASTAASRRQEAMKRHYARHLHVMELASEGGSDGWMWRPMNNACPLPRIT